MCNVQCCEIHHNVSPIMKQLHQVQAYYRTFSVLFTIICIQEQVHTGGTLHGFCGVTLIREMSSVYNLLLILKIPC